MRSRRWSRRGDARKDLGPLAGRDGESEGVPEVESDTPLPVAEQLPAVGPERDGRPVAAWHERSARKDQSISVRGTKVSTGNGRVTTARPCESVMTSFPV